MEVILEEEFDLWFLVFEKKPRIQFFVEFKREPLLRYVTLFWVSLVRGTKVHYPLPG